MFPYPVTPWASAEPPHSCGSHGSPAQPLPDLLCSCPPPQAHAAPETPSPDPPGSIIVVTQYESSRSPAGPEDEEVGGLRTMASVVTWLIISNPDHFLTGFSSSLKPKVQKKSGKAASAAALCCVSGTRRWCSVGQMLIS